MNKNVDNKVNKKESYKSPKTTILKSFKVHNESPLLEFLYSHIQNDSRNNIKHYLSNHQILVNGTCTTQYNFMIYKEDIVQISKNPVLKVKNQEKKLKIIYEDDDLIAIDKPSGLLSIESDDEKYNTAYRMLTDYVQKKDKHARIFVVHRIDKDTSGVLLVAKNEMTKKLFQNNWQKIVKKREYLAICEGIFKEKKGTVKSYLKSNQNHLMYSSKDKSGQLAITHYQVMKENNQYSLVDVLIDTGRKNQIRVHMGDLQHKIVGDDKYGPVSNPIHRLGLHAYVLVLTHPVSKKEMVFKAEIPACFKSLFGK